MRVALPEQIWIDIEPASFGSRALAYLIDFALRWFLIIVMVLAVIFLLAQAGLDAGKSFDVFRHVAGGGNVILTAILVLLLFLLNWSYPIYFEVCRNGVTPGKGMLGLRVVDENGLPITFRVSCLRTVMTLVDLLPGLGLTAFVSMSVSKKSQRLGDLVARTMVVYSPRSGEGAEEFDSARTHTADITLPLELFNIIEKYIARRTQFAPAARAANLAAILQAIRDLCKSVQVPELPNGPAQEQWLMHLYKRAKPAKQSASKLAADREVHWRSVQQELTAYERILTPLERSAAPLSVTTLQAMAQAYQELCQRYAHLATFYPNTSAAKRAARLVRYGRRLIYGTRLSALNESAAPPFLMRVTRSFHAIRWHCAAAAAVAVAGGLLAAALIRVNPALAWHFLDETAVQKVREGHLWTEQVQGMSSLASSSIMTNNINVTLACYAMGITGGVGTIAMMIFNGVHLGGVFAALAIYDMAYPLFNFIVAHGFLELSVIVVAGGCGLFIGDALLSPGPLSRKAALQRHARATADLVLFNVPCLVVAGIVEGFVSPYPWIPFPVKLGIGLLLGGVYWSLLVRGKLGLRSVCDPVPPRRMQ